MKRTCTVFPPLRSRFLIIRNDEAVPDRLDLYLLLDVLLEAFQGIDIILACKAYRLARCACPGCTSYPVHIVLAVLREIVVDDVGYAFDMKAPGRYVRRH